MGANASVSCLALLVSRSSKRKSEKNLESIARHSRSKNSL